MTDIKTIKDLAIDHNYYCSTSNYFKNDCCEHYETFDDFIDDRGKDDLDYNMVFRWDVKPNDEDEGEAAGFYMEIFIMQQRKGLFQSCVIDEVTDADVSAIIEYLKPRWEYMREIWKPFEK
jgi:hypothetical protein